MTQFLSCRRFKSIWGFDGKHGYALLGADHWVWVVTRINRRRLRLDRQVVRVIED